LMDMIWNNSPFYVCFNIVHSKTIAKATKYIFVSHEKTQFTKVK
jgi:hypothetical protein